MEAAYGTVQDILLQHCTGTLRDPKAAQVQLVAILNHFPVLKDFVLSESLKLLRAAPEDSSSTPQGQADCRLQHFDRFCLPLNSIIEASNPILDRKLMGRLLTAFNEDVWLTLIQSAGLSSLTVTALVTEGIYRLEGRHKELTLQHLLHNPWLLQGLERVTRSLLRDGAALSSSEGGDGKHRDLQQRFSHTVVGVQERLQLDGTSVVHKLRTPEEREKREKLASMLKTLLGVLKAQEQRVRVSTSRCACQSLLDSVSKAQLQSTDPNPTPAERSLRTSPVAQSILQLVTESTVDGRLEGAALDRELLLIEAKRGSEDLLGALSTVLLALSGREERIHLAAVRRAPTPANLVAGRTDPDTSLVLFKRTMFLCNRLISTCRSPLLQRASFALSLLVHTRRLFSTAHCKSKGEAAKLRDWSSIHSGILTTLELLAHKSVGQESIEAREDVMRLHSELTVMLMQLLRPNETCQPMQKCCQFGLSILSRHWESTVNRLLTEVEYLPQRDFYIQRLRCLMGIVLSSSMPDIESLRQQRCGEMLLHVVRRIPSQAASTEKCYSSWYASLAWQLLCSFLAAQCAKHDGSAKKEEELCQLFTALLFMQDNHLIDHDLPPANSQELVKLWVVLLWWSAQDSGALGLAPAPKVGKAIQLWLQRLLKGSSNATAVVPPDKDTHWQLMDAIQTLSLTGFAPMELVDRLSDIFQVAAIIVGKTVYVTKVKALRNALQRQLKTGRDSLLLNGLPLEGGMASHPGRDLTLRICSLRVENVDPFYGDLLRTQAHNGAASPAHPRSSTTVAEAVLALLKDHYLSRVTEYSEAERQVVMKAMNRFCFGKGPGWSLFEAFLVSPPPSVFNLLGIDPSCALPSLALSKDLQLANQASFRKCLTPDDNGAFSALRLEAALKVYINQKRDNGVPNLRQFTFVIVLGLLRAHATVAEDILFIMEKYGDLIDVEIVASVLQQLPAILRSLSKEEGPLLHQKAPSLLKLLALAVNSQAWDLLFTPDFVVRLVSDEAASLAVHYIDWLFREASMTEISRFALCSVAALLCNEALSPAVEPDVRKKAQTLVDGLIRPLGQDLVEASKSGDEEMTVPDSANGPCIHLIIPLSDRLNHSVIVGTFYDSAFRRRRFIDESVLRKLMSFWPYNSEAIELRTLWLPGFSQWLKRQVNDAWRGVSSVTESSSSQKTYEYLEFAVCKFYRSVEYDGSLAALMTDWVHTLIRLPAFGCSREGGEEGISAKRETAFRRESPLMLVYRTGCLLALQDDGLWFLRVFHHVLVDPTADDIKLEKLLRFTPKDVLWEAVASLCRFDAVKGRLDTVDASEAIGASELLRSVFTGLKSRTKRMQQLFLVTLLSVFCSTQAAMSGRMSTLHHWLAATVSEEEHLNRLLVRHWAALKAHLTGRSMARTNGLPTGTSQLALDNIERVLLAAQRTRDPSALKTEVVHGKILEQTMTQVLNDGTEFLVEEVGLDLNDEPEECVDENVSSRADVEKSRHVPVPVPALKSETRRVSLSNESLERSLARDSWAPLGDASPEPSAPQNRASPLGSKDLANNIQHRKKRGTIAAEEEFNRITQKFRLSPSATTRKEPPAQERLKKRPRQPEKERPSQQKEMGRPSQQEEMKRPPQPETQRPRQPEKQRPAQEEEMGRPPQPEKQRPRQSEKQRPALQEEMKQRPPQQEEVGRPPQPEKQRPPQLEEVGRPPQPDSEQPPKREDIGRPPQQEEMGRPPQPEKQRPPQQEEAKRAAQPEEPEVKLPVVKQRLRSAIHMSGQYVSVLEEGAANRQAVAVSRKRKSLSLSQQKSIERLKRERQRR